MARQDWVNLLNYGSPWQTTQGTQLATSASTATISPQAGGNDFVLPGQDSGLQWYQGMSLLIEARGSYGSAGTTSNLTIFLGAGSNPVASAPTATLATTGALTLGAGTVSSLRWRMRVQVDVVAITTAAAAFLAVEGEFLMQTAVAPATIVGAATNVNLIPVAYTTINGSVLSPYTAATALAMKATLSAAFGNVQCDRFTITQIG